MDTNMALSSEKLSREPYLIEKDGDYVVDDENRLPFEHKKALGSGYSAVVDKVEDTRSNMVFARKVVKFRHGRFRKRTEELYRDEVDIIRRLKTHHHVIRLFATYKTKEGGSLLLQPVADEGNLEEYLGKYSEATVFLDPTSIAMMTRVLKQAFGCLATGLAFIHERGIRHKDIKSSNILIYKGRIIYTDFGAAKDTIKDGECTTEGKPEFLTRKYCAPEVLEHDKRNYAADVYSLGCIFVDILFAMSPLVDHEQKPGQHFSDIMDDVHLELLSAKVPATLSFLSNLTVSMTMREPTKRPESPVIVTELCCNPEICCTACRQNVPGVDTLSMSGGNTRKWSGLPNPSLGLKASSSYDMSQPEWNAEFQRYLYKYWDERQQRDYWTHHVEGWCRLRWSAR
jgi:serine/threonine protein kinase